MESLEAVHPEWTTLNVAAVASEASVLIEKLITLEAFVLMYVLWQ